MNQIDLDFVNMNTAELKSRTQHSKYARVQGKQSARQHTDGQTINGQEIETERLPESPVATAINTALNEIRLNGLRLNGATLRNVFDVRRIWNGVSTGMSGASSPAGSSALERFMLWIDGVGAYLVCLNGKTTIGGPTSQSDVADISLMAQIGRCHATVVRVNEGYILEAHAPTRVKGRDVIDEALLSDGAEIEMGNGVRLAFRQPSALSSTALLEFVSDHRPSFSVDGIILMDETCLLGPGADCHIRCPDWQEPVVLVRRGDQLGCQSRTPLFVKGDVVNKSTRLTSGSVVSGSDCQFRIEAVERAI